MASAESFSGREHGDEIALATLEQPQHDSLAHGIASQVEQDSLRVENPETSRPPLNRSKLQLTATMFALFVSNNLQSNYPVYLKVGRNLF